MTKIHFRLLFNVQNIQYSRTVFSYLRRETLHGDFPRRQISYIDACLLDDTQRDYNYYGNVFI